MRYDYLLAASVGLAIGWLAAGRGEKTTDLRMWDVFVLGPWLIAIASPDGTVGATEKLLLAFVGGATIGYNGRNALVSSPEQIA